MSVKLWFSERSKDLAHQSLAIFGFLSILLVAILGVLLSLGCTFEKRISLQIDLAGIFTLVATIILGVVVLRTLQRRDDDEKLERDILIGTFKDLDSSFGRFIHKMASKATIDPIQTAATFKQYGMDLQDVNELAIGENFIQASDTDELLAVFSQLKAAFDLPPVVSEGGDSRQASLTEPALSEIEAMARDFRIKIFKVIVVINRVQR